MSGDPAAHARETFCRQLRELLAAAGTPSFAMLSSVCAVPPQTLNDLVNGRFKRVPPWQRVEAFVRACAVSSGGHVPADLGLWRERYNRLEAVLDATGTCRTRRRPAAPARPGPGVRRQAAPGQPVGQVHDPFALEVHPAIEVGAAAAELPVLPTYVPRDHDERLREVLRQAVDGHSALAVLVGGSSAGKTRACWEAVQTLPEDWLLWHPINPGRPEAVLDGLPRVGPRTVVWLNEAQHYLLTPSADLGERVAAGLRDLLRDPRRRPVLVLATVWPDYWAALVTAAAGGQPDPHAQARALLAGHDIPVEGAFTEVALACAEAAGREDPRLAEAHAHAHHGMITQYLAGVPALLERYRNAPPAAKALIEAAMDARRLGHHPALPHALLADAAPGYLTDDQWDALGDDWLDQALAYTAAPCRGARGPLTRIRPRPGQPSHDQPHYRLADYLEQHARAARRTRRAPASLWEAFVRHTRDPRDAARLADSADRRLLYDYAVPLYRQAADAGDVAATIDVVDLLLARGEVDSAIEVMQAPAHAGDRSLAVDLTGLLAERGDIDGLRARADTGDDFAAHRLADLLAERGDTHEAIARMEALADTGDDIAVTRLTDLLAERGDIDGLRARADTGDDFAAHRLADLLAARGDTDDAVALLRPRADTGDGYAAHRLAELLAERGDIDGLRARASAGDWSAANHLADLFIERGGNDYAIHELRALADAGNEYAAARLTPLLIERGDIDEAIGRLRASADAGNYGAAERLAHLLAERGDINGLRARASTGEWPAAHCLADLLVARGDLDGAIDGLRAHADTGHGFATNRLIHLLAARGDIDEAADRLRALAEGGDWTPADRLARLLTEHGDIDGAIDWLQTQADAGSVLAPGRLADLLVECGDIDELRARADTGEMSACARLADLLVECGDIDELRARADTGEVFACARLADLLATRGDVDGLRARADTGDVHAAEHLADLLAENGDADGLRALIADGTVSASSRLYNWSANLSADPPADRLADILAERGRPEEAIRLRRFGLNPDGSTATGPAAPAAATGDTSDAQPLHAQHTSWPISRHHPLLTPPTVTVAQMPAQPETDR